MGVTAGQYEEGENILHLWYPSPVDLSDERTLVAFFDEVEADWIRPCPRKPYLLVNYKNVRIPPAMTSTYAQRIQHLRPLVLGTFRYGISADLTGVAVAIGNLTLQAQANIYPDEASARAAIRAAAR